MRLRVLACGFAMLWGSGVADARNCPQGAFENFPPGEATAVGFDPAVLADAIQDLRRSAPGHLPIQAPTRFELVLNLRTAKALGFHVQRDFMLRADEVLE